MTAIFECFGMTFVTEFYDDCGTFDIRKVWARSGGWEVEVTWDMIDGLRYRHVNPITKVESYFGSPRAEFDTAMEDAMQMELAKYGRDDE